MVHAVRSKPAMGLFLSWSATGSVDAAGRRRIVEAARAAEERGFDSIWLLEDDSPGGVRANPALMAASVAVSTDAIRVCAQFLDESEYDSLRAVEDWSVVDNLSSGRLELFSKNPRDHHRTVRHLWAGKEIRRVGLGGEEQLVQTYPKPYQSRVALWLPYTEGAPGLDLAVELNAGILVRDEGLALDQLAARVRGIRHEFAADGHEPGRVAILAGVPDVQHDIRELYALDVDEVVCRLDVDAAGDRLAETMAEIARGRPE
ncbi:LLM class flavin-dependent oxidoreductase [Kutzneria buriramensis]|uniref:Alkanesulfonate monooxygenase SsuD/methylene tetrahydromethanopterin reductase-like flavin-dependent oxidoreductase (Luciferase family) n=1 Tax=Kutzneria buriramensis TaxID=1045776 RepID=A0A3E0H1H4_9PSEU|nr:LLM class flavin-dependent oxidoreductase [Kutzneria buriramensis]REH36376.1 alkanesulfonate monooxygenase SsuD/methylene tetrahydromethanopterin reductase-like flavin-dependent oxidoreductase (luciferase family) [Kutzneria buriramensis]